ncbi:SEM7A protein, partial [Picathartes gymnocephalus]|nr:SEM7A protein [Picathartes gymnocephalus]
DPQFVKATTLRHEEPHQDKIYYFFREDNPDKSPEAPRNISRVAQLCKVPAGVARFDPPGWGQDSVWLGCRGCCSIPHARVGVWGFLGGSSAVCVYSFGDIDAVFRTSRLKGYNGPSPEVKPGQCVPAGQHTPSETFKIADSHPEVEERVEPLGPGRSPLFHNKHRYRKIGVHQVAAGDGRRYNVLYLATDKGSIHKVVELPDGVQNVVEIQVFPSKDPIHSMILDHARAVLYVGSGSRVLELPMDMCGAYRNNCHSCVLARDPYCGWANGSCLSLALARGVLQNLSVDSWRGSCQRSDVKEGMWGCDFRNISVTPLSRYYLNCSIESHYATYNWYHEDALVKSCNTSRPQPDCFHFIPSVRREHYGHYVCVSEEDGFRQALVKERLMDRRSFLPQRGRAPPAPAPRLHPLLVLLVLLVLARLLH